MTAKKIKKAIILHSGGLDSTTCLYWALSKGYECICLNITYGQRHKKETECCRKICKKLKVKLIEISFKLPWLEDVTSLVGNKIAIPNEPLSAIKSIGRLPSTYVPARNLIFASIAASLADSIGANAIVLGANAIDYSGYPDCRPRFYKPLERAIFEGTRSAVGGPRIEVLTPLLKMSKAQITKLGAELGVPFGLTWSCYRGGKTPCGKCDACRLRKAGFEKAKVKDI